MQYLPLFSTFKYGPIYNIIKQLIMKFRLRIDLTVFCQLIVIIYIAESRCMYNIDQNYFPFHTDAEPFPLGTLSGCKDYVSPGRLGCCNRYNDEATLKNFKQIDGIFGSQGGGCDICAINLKRFWCQYACSDRQHEFMETAKEYEPFADPQKPGNTIMGQRVNVRVHAQSACKIYNSCKRNSFVASVSAMGSTAGFLNFQGHNAIDDGHQYVTFNFSYNRNDSLFFTDELDDFAYGEVTSCDFKTSEPQIHNFTMSENCTCNTCEEACDPNEGFVYTEPYILEGFNYRLVGGTYAFVIVVAGVVSYYRHRKSKSQ